MLLGATTLTNDALGWLLDLAHDDQLHYLKFGSPEMDYGDEWPETSKQRAGWCREIAAATGSIHGEPERWESLAKMYEDAGEDEDATKPCDRCETPVEVDCALCVDCSNKDLLCRGCGREEGACSLDPCDGVLKDRAS